MLVDVTEGQHKVVKQSYAKKRHQRKGAMALAVAVDNENNEMSPPMDYESIHKAIKQDLHFADDNRRVIPSLDHRNMDLQYLLGTGSFCEVFSVSIAGRDTTDHTTEDSDSESDEGGLSLGASKSSCISLIKPKYAIKRVRKDLQDDEHMRHVAIVDTYYEYEILAHLPRHENIVNLVAVNQGFIQKPCFLVLERVSETLKQKLLRWSISKYSESNTSVMHFRKRSRQQALQQRSRIECCAVGIARALHFLHSHGIVYRDLKPTNIGFGYDGEIKCLISAWPAVPSFLQRQANPLEDSLVTRVL